MKSRLDILSDIYGEKETGSDSLLPEIGGELREKLVQFAFNRG